MWAILVGTHHIEPVTASKMTPRQFRVLSFDNVIAYRRLQDRRREIEGPTQSEQRAHLRNVRDAVLAKRKRELDGRGR